MHMLLRIVALLFLSFAVPVPAVQPAFAVEPDEVLADPALEARARALSAELRCLVCQNQSIDDSDAPLARDLRILVRDRLKAGDTDAEVRAYIVERYGAFVLLRPPLGWNTLLLWLFPFLILVAAGVVIYRYSRVQQSATRREKGGAPLSANEQERLNRLLGEEAGAGSSAAHSSSRPSAGHR